MFQVNDISCRGKRHAELLDSDFTTSPHSFSTGVISLVLYYRFLHPKSFEIFQSIRRRGIGGACMEHGSTLSLEEKVTPTFHRHAMLSGLLPACLVSPSFRPSLLQLICLSGNLFRWGDSYGSPYPVGGLETSSLAADPLGPENRSCNKDLVSVRGGGTGRTDGFVRRIPHP